MILQNSSTQFDNSDFDKDEDIPNFNSKIPFDSQKWKDFISNKYMPSSLHRKSKKEYRNRSSEFTKHNLNMVD